MPKDEAQLYAANELYVLSTGTMNIYIYMYMFVNCLYHKITVTSCDGIYVLPVDCHCHDLHG